MMNRKDFNLLNNTIYLDSGSGTLKPIQVIEAITDFYQSYPVNPHSPDSKLGIKVLEKIRQTRTKCATLLDASDQEIIFTSGTTDSLNRLARMLEPRIKKLDQILISPYNHASNIIVWQELAKRTGAILVYSKTIIDQINSRTKIIAYAQMNNTLAQELNLKLIYQQALKVKAFVVNDAAQAIVHQKISLTIAHAIVFSGTKIYGPTGIGVLAIRASELVKMKPTTYGGGANQAITLRNWERKSGICGFESGTPNTAGIIGLGAALDYFIKYADFAHELKLATYAYDRLQTIPNIKFYSKRKDKIILFNIGNYHPQDVVSYLGHKNIILRAGKHCAKLVPEFKIKPVIRLSIASYNNFDDLDQCVKALKLGGNFLDFI